MGQRSAGLSGETSVVDWVIDYPETGPVLESLGIDCSCAGKSLEYLCRQRDLDLSDVLEQLGAAIATTACGTKREPGR